MPLDAASQLGEILGTLNKDQDIVRQNMSPDVVEALDQYFIRLTFSFSGAVTATKKTYPTDSFILDHPVYGELDSAVLKLNGGYSSGELTIPITIPIEFTGGDIVIDTQSF